MNFTYLQDVFGENFPAGGDQRYLRELMEDSRAVRVLKSAGYQIATFEGEYWGAQIGGADYNFKEWWFRNIFDIGVLQDDAAADGLKCGGYPRA